jgi:hypothetical protein
MVTTILLLKTTGNKTCFIVLNGSIRASLNLVDPHAHDQNRKRRTRKNIPSTSMLKSSILLSHTKLPLRISNNILIGVRLRKRDC